MQALSEQKANELIRGMNIPPQPQIIADLQIIQFSDDPSVSDIVEIIGHDASVTGNVLKVANSPFYGLEKPITSVEHSVLMLGLQSVMNIVNAVILRSELKPQRPLSDNEQQFLNKFWDTSEDTAKVATILSRELGTESPDDLYVLGLFQNAGIPLMLQQHVDYQQTLIQAYTLSEDLITAAENTQYNTNHAVIGYYLARAWNMPKALCQAIAQHHNAYEVFTRNELSSHILNYIAILKLAEHIAAQFHHLGHHEVDLEWLSISSTILEYLNISDEELEDLVLLCHELGVLSSTY